jgi:hypothetical protein
MPRAPPAFLRDGVPHAPCRRRGASAARSPEPGDGRAGGWRRVGGRKKKKMLSNSARLFQSTSVCGPPAPQDAGMLRDTGARRPPRRSGGGPPASPPLRRCVRDRAIVRQDGRAKGRCRGQADRNGTPGGVRAEGGRQGDIRPTRHNHRAPGRNPIREFTCVNPRCQPHFQIRLPSEICIISILADKANFFSLSSRDKIIFKIRLQAYVDIWATAHGYPCPICVNADLPGRRRHAPAIRIL